MINHLNRLDILAYGRKILGRKLANIIKNTVAEVSFKLGIAPTPDTKRPNCISALMRVKNEEWWIEPSILSIKDLVEEYVIVDGSDEDRTPEIIEEVKAREGLNIKHVIDYDQDIVAVSNRGLRLTSCRWVLRWDGDFIAKDEMPSYIKTFIEGLDRNRYYNIYWPHICLDGDLYHQDLRNPLHVEHWLVSYSPGTKFVWNRGVEYLVTPYYHKRIELLTPLSFHLRTVKPPKRLLHRKYWSELLRNNLLGSIDIKEYIIMRIKEEYNTDDIDKAAEIYFNEFLKRLHPYNKEKYGDLPSILKNYSRGVSG